MIIGLSGYARSGKDTAAEFLVDEYEFFKTAFADALREALYVLNPIVVANAEYHGMLPPKGGYEGFVYQRLRYVIDRWGWDGAKSSPFSGDVRTLLQVMGTEVGRDMIDQDVWVNTTFRKFSTVPNLVITDCRFPNEADAIRAKGGKVIRIERIGVGPANSHVSEVSLDNYEFDAWVGNHGTLDEFHTALRACMAHM